MSRDVGQRGRWFGRRPKHLSLSLSRVELRVWSRFKVRLRETLGLGWRGDSGDTEVTEIQVMFDIWSLAEKQKHLESSRRLKVRCPVSTSKPYEYSSTQTGPFITQGCCFTAVNVRANKQATQRGSLHLKATVLHGLLSTILYQCWKVLYDGSKCRATTMRLNNWALVH